jgi:dTMP kinase
MPRGGQARFLVIEGLDGAGTTTQAELVAGALRARGLDVCLTAEPSDGPLGAVARAHVRTEITLGPQAAALAFVGDRADHLDRVIRPALAAGSWVVCDRYVLSTLAYQGAEGVDRLWVLRASGELDRPDLTVFLDVPQAERRARMAARPSSDRYEARALQEALERSYTDSLQLLRSQGHHVVVVDGTGDSAAVCAAILSELDALP